MGCAGALILAPRDETDQEKARACGLSEEVDGRFSAVRFQLVRIFEIANTREVFLTIPTFLKHCLSLRLYRSSNGLPIETAYLSLGNLGWQNSVHIAYDARSNTLNVRIAIYTPAGSRGVHARKRAKA